MVYYFSGGRWCWCMQIGNKIGNGYICFMFDGVDNWNVAGKNCLCYVFVVKIL